MICGGSRLLSSLLFLLWGLLWSQNLLAQECTIKPDASLKDAKIGGKPFINCTSASAPSYTLRLQNTSQTKELNTNYSLDWGDGSPVEDLGSFGAIKSHTYSRLDTYKILFTVKIGNCEETREYSFFNGNVPDFTISFKIDDCAPVSENFVLGNVDDNEPSTIYNIDFGDGSTITFGQRDLKKYINPDPKQPNTYAIPHTYTVPSFGKESGYEAKITASNTCRTVVVTRKGIYVYKGPTPDFKMNPEPVSCLNSPVTLTDVSDYGYNATEPGDIQFERKWTIEPASGQPTTSWSFAPGSDEKSERPIINFTQTGEYKISINLLPLEGTSPKCEGGTVSKTIKVITPPIASFTADLNPVSGCAATVSTNNTAIGEAVSYQWTVTPSAGVTTSNGSFTSKDPVFVFANAGNYTINLQVKNLCGTSSATPVPVTIKNVPTISLTPAAPPTYCGPQTITFSPTSTNHKLTYNYNNTTAHTYAWSVSGPDGGAIFTNIGGSTAEYPTINFKQAGTYTVSVTATNECGTSTLASQTIKINDIPAAPEVADASICINSATTLSTTSPGTIGWFTVPTGGTAKSGNSYPTGIYTTAGTYKVYVQTTVNGCTSPRKAITITVNPAIDPKVISGVPPICAGNAPNALIGPAATGGGNTITYLWESSTTSATATDFVTATGKDNSPNNQQNFQPGILTKTTYFRRKAISLPCATATSNVVAIVVNPLPAKPVIPAVNSVCAGNTATITANPVSGITFTWYDANGTILQNTSATSNTYTTAPLTQEGNYTFYASSKNTNNCLSSERTEITVQVLPAITNNNIISQQADFICAGEIPSLISSAIKPEGGNGYNSFTYLWQSKIGQGTWQPASNGADPQHSNTSENYQPTAITRTTAYRRMITSGACAAPSYSNELVIQVIPSSLPPEVADVTPICAGQFTYLKVTSTGSTYEWFATPVSTEVLYTGSTFTTPVLTATTTYYVHNRTANCVSPRVAVEVKVNPLITDNTFAPVSAVCTNGVPNKLVGSEPKNGSGPGTFTYRWDSRTEFSSFAPVNGDDTYSKDKKDFQPGVLAQTTWFRRIVRSGNCENVSEEIKVEVLKNVAGNTITASNGIEFCAGEIATKLINKEQISGGNGQYTYVWESSNDEFKTNKTIVAQGQEAAFAEYTPQNLTQTTWYRRIITSGPCLANTSNIVKITINPLPAAPVVAPIDPVCAGGSATITATPVNGITFTAVDETGNSLPANTSEANRFTTPALTLPKTYTFYVIAKNNNNCNSTRTQVTVQALPTLNNFNITQPAPICSGESPSEITSAGAPTGGNNTFTYVWQRKTGHEEFKTITSPSSNPNFKPGALTESTWFRRIITSGACSETSNAVEVKVNQPVVNTLQSPNQELCADVRPGKILGNPATGGDGVNYTYFWETSLDNIVFTEAVVAQGESNSQVDFQPALLKQNTYFRRKVISGFCIHYSTPVLIKINQPIAENIIRLTGNPFVCANTRPDPIQGSTPTGGNGAPAFLWKISTDGLNFTDAPQPNTGKDYTPGILVKPTWFQRIVNAGNCLPSNSATIKIDVYQPVTNNRIESGNEEICQGTTASLLLGSLPQLGNGDFKYRWESKEEKQAAFLTATGNFSEKDYAPGILPKGTWYFRRWVIAGPCQEIVSQTVKITVNDPISAHFITANQTIRVGDKPATLTGPKPKGGNTNFTYRWETSENNQTFTKASGNTLQQSYAPPVLSKTTWFRRIAISGGCESVSNLVEITVAQAIANNTISASQTICYNTEAALLTGSAPTGGDGDFSFIWEYSQSGLANDFFTAPNQAFSQDYQPGKLKQTTWFRRKVSSAGNTNISSVLKITVRDPISSNSITGSQTICYGNTPNNLTGSVITGGSGSLPNYLWESSTDGTTFLTATGASNQATYSPGAITRTTWFRRTVIMEGCTSNTSNTVQVTVNSAPLITPVAPIEICPGTSTTITVQSQASQIEWYETATSNIIIHKGASFTTAVLQSDRTYYVQATNQGCTGERLAININVGLPVADAGADVSIKPGRATELQGKGGITYQWSPVEGLNNPNIANPIATPKQSTTYTLTVTTADGCTATDQVLVSLTPGLFIPNGFTPDRDGINDTWEITNIDKYPDCQVKIFNRWGTIIYSSDGYKQPWDGTYNKQELPVATYYYTIILTKDEKPVSGSVTIIK